MLSDEGTENLALEFAAGAYEASTLIGDFRPAFVVVDDRVLGTGESELLESLAHETRIPGLKVILAVSRGGKPVVPKEESHLDGFIRRPFDRQQLATFLSQMSIERVAEGN
jgi:hypothetical protein